MSRLLATLAALCALALPAAATEIEEVVSEGGVTIWLVEEDSIPIVSIELHFGGGARLDPEGEIGATRLMTALLDEGAGEMDAVAFAERREILAARFGFDSGQDGVTVSAAMLSENREESVGLLATALSEPRFDAAALERVRGQALSSLEARTRDPEAIARRAFREAVFGDHPYGRPAEGTAETVAALTADDLRAAHARSLTRDRVTVSVVGDIRAAEVGPMIDRLLDGLPASGPPLPPAAEVRSGEDIVIPFDVPQSVAIFGHEGLAREDPDFIPAYVANTIVGAGGFGSRLSEVIREERGLTYGIYAYLSPRDLAALYLGSVRSANASMAEVVDLVRAEWRRAEAGVTAEELAAAKRYLTGAYALRFSSNGSIADALVGMQRAELPLDYINIRNDLIEAVTLEEVNRVAAELYRPERLRFVIVGEPEGLAATQ